MTKKRISRITNQTVCWLVRHKKSGKFIMGEGIYRFTSKETAEEWLSRRLLPLPKGTKQDDYEVVGERVTEIETREIIPNRISKKGRKTP